MSLLQFNTDVMFEIAKYDENVWWKIWLFSIRFRKYTKRNVAPLVNLCIKSHKSNCTTIWYFFDRIHRENDQPAIVRFNDEKEWWYNGVRHRENDQPAVVLQDGSQWYYHGERHRENDQPAVIDSYHESWYHRDKLHRENGPAVIYVYGTQEWWHQGVKHRENDQPAVINHDGTQIWYYNGFIHRENDQPAVIRHDGTQEWWYKGKCHRENDQPAIIRWNGTQEWKHKGKTHRDDNKPAIVSTSRVIHGIQIKKLWYINGEIVGSCEELIENLDIHSEVSKKKESTIFKEQCTALTLKGVRCKNGVKVEGLCLIHFRKK